ncbi:MAG TPA: DNA polymerase/3'-5' exonuclease PolX [Cyanobacteria bacterium UBA8530]|nr:DNA polymerase/3'-5' exonuclease PolX [Cyanobacteria bacterium UBA8530]
MRNRQVARLLDSIADALEIRGEGRFRTNAYREAARNIENLPGDIEEIWREEKLEDIPGVGKSIASKISQYLESGHSLYLEEISRALPTGLTEILGIPGLGPKKARILHDRLGVSSVEELVAAAQRHEIQKIKGMGAKSEANILKGIERFRQSGKRLLLGEAWPLADQVARMLSECPWISAISPAGSIRRRAETIGDIDVLAASSEPEKAMDAFLSLSIVREVLMKGPTKSSILTGEGLQIDLRVVAPDSYGAALQYFTGSKSHNVELRGIAISKGLKLNEYGLFRIDSGARLAGRNEEEIYEALGLAWMPPELRESRGELEAAAEGRLPDLVEIGDLRGDLHSHTDWSDGRDSLEEMARAAIAHGYQYLAITDHSHSLGVAHGLDARRVREQGEQIESLNKKLAPFKLLHGCEVEILNDGHLDYPDELLASFDLIGASLHLGMGQSSEKITRRILTAFRSRVDILNHPTGRLLNQRPPFEVDLAAVFAAARKRGIALEVNGQPSRLDLKDIDARRARDLGIPLALDTDSHQSGGLDAMRYAVATARRGWVEKKDVINTLDLDQLLQYLGRERKAA